MVGGGTNTSHGYQLILSAKNFGNSPYIYIIYVCMYRYLGPEGILPHVRIEILGILWQNSLGCSHKYSRKFPYMN